MDLDWFRWRRMLPALLAVLCLVTAALAGDDKPENSTNQYKWHLTVYGGASAQKDINDVVTFQAKFTDNAYIVVAALARELWHYKKYLDFEIEGQLGKHFNRDTLWEFNGLVVGRWHLFPWNDYVRTSFAVGEGMSYYSEVSRVEKEEDDENATRLLNYLLFELATGLPAYPKWDLVFRIHHRSSVWGLIGAGGSNYVCAGVKYSF